MTDTPDLAHLKALAEKIRCAQTEDDPCCCGPCTLANGFLSLLNGLTLGELFNAYEALRAEHDALKAEVAQLKTDIELTLDSERRWKDEALQYAAETERVSSLLDALKAENERLRDAASIVDCGSLKCLFEARAIAAEASLARLVEEREKLKAQQPQWQFGVDFASGADWSVSWPRCLVCNQPIFHGHACAGAPPQ